MRTTAALTLLLLLAGCGKAAPPVSPVQGLRIQALPGATFRYLQRNLSDGTWDEGKPIDADIGRRILACLDGAVAWNPHDRPGEAAAWGVHAHAPAFVSALQVHRDGKGELVTFCYTLGLIQVRSEYPYCVVPDERRAELTALLKSLGDPDRQTVAR